MKLKLRTSSSIPSSAKERLIAEDGRAAEIIKPYLRGQDIYRWLPGWAGLWMIFARRGIDIRVYPSVLRHLESYRTGLEPKPDGWRPATKDGKWAGRKEGTYQWYEVQDSIDYWQMFERPKILYQKIQFYRNYALDTAGLFGNNKTFIIPSSDPSLLSVLGSPLMWWHNWRYLAHMKDEALTPMGYRMEALPIAPFDRSSADHASEKVNLLRQSVTSIRAADHALADWLRHEIGLAKLPATLAQASRLNSDGFIAAVRAALPKRAGITPSRQVQLRAAFADTAEPARAARVAAQADERTLSDIVNRAYGLTPEDVALMWRTAPPRMPLAAPASDAAELPDAAADLD